MREYGSGEERREGDWDGYGNSLSFAGASVTVGVARVAFVIHGNRSLKEKRKVVKSLIEKSRHRFNVSVAEVAQQQAHQKATIGVSVIGSDSRLVNSLLDRIIDYMDSLHLADMVDHEIELISL